MMTNSLTEAMNGASRFVLDDPVAFMVAVALVPAILLVVLILVGVGIWHVLKNPFRYPYYHRSFDVSRRRNVDIEEEIERFLLDPQNRAEVEQHRLAIEQWKAGCEARIAKRLLKKRRRRQYASVIDDMNAYRFETTRNQTRYRQQNYVKHAYKITATDERKAVGYPWLEAKMRQLDSVGYETTLKQYHAKEQRRLMTPQLRKQIMERDNYTCQHCGKYMPDEVGLQIDHVVPVAQGGKTVPSNLQVLCSKCNGSKGGKPPTPVWAR